MVCAATEITKCMNGVNSAKINRIKSVQYWHRGHAVAQWFRHCATNRKVTGSIPMVSLELFIDIILLAALCPWGRLSL
jgi:hypothetical protein